MDSRRLNQLPTVFSFKKKFLLVFFPFAIAFILSCLFRTMNAVLIPTLESLININVEQLGLLNASYFLAYALFQIPLGTFLDNYGAQRTQTILFLIGGLGLIISGLSTSVWVITSGHFLIGIGMSGGLMAAFKIISQWFPNEKIPMLNGIMMTFGGLGILLSATPTEWLARHYGWEFLNISFGALSIITAMLIFLVVPDLDHNAQRTSFKSQLKGVLSIFKSIDFWKLAPLTTGVLASFMSIHGLWVEGWLSNISGFHQELIDIYLVLMALAMTVSLLSTGFIAKLANNLKIPLEKVLSLLLVIYIFIEVATLFLHGNHEWILWVLISLVSQVFNLSYAILTQKFHKSYAGRASTALNVIVFTTTFIMQYSIGLIINLLNAHHSINQSYLIAFSLPIAFQIITLIVYYAFLNKN